MKNLLLTIATVSMIFSSAEARSVKPFLMSAQLKEMHIDQKSYLAQEDLDKTGSISINQATKTITLQLNRKMHCPPGRYCPMVMPEPVLITLPLVSVKQGHCDSVIYQARKDKRPVDGILEVLTVVDNSRFYNRCRTVRAVDITEVHYETSGYNRMEREQLKTHSVFTAEKLQSSVINN